MNAVIDTLLFEYRYHPDPINDADEHVRRVEVAREQLGERVVCHPANRVKPVWRGPCQSQQ